MKEWKKEENQIGYGGYSVWGNGYKGGLGRVIRIYMFFFWNGNYIKREKDLEVHIQQAN